MAQMEANQKQKLLDVRDFMTVVLEIIPKRW